MPLLNSRMAWLVCFRSMSYIRFFCTAAFSDHFTIAPFAARLLERVQCSNTFQTHFCTAVDCFQVAPPTFMSSKSAARSNAKVCTCAIWDPGGSIPLQAVTLHAHRGNLKVTLSASTRLGTGDCWWAGLEDNSVGLCLYFRIPRWACVWCVCASEYLCALVLLHVLDVLVLGTTLVGKGKARPWCQQWSGGASCAEVHTAKMVFEECCTGFTATKISCAGFSLSPSCATQAHCPARVPAPSAPSALLKFCILYLYLYLMPNVLASSAPSALLNFCISYLWAPILR